MTESVPLTKADQEAIRDAYDAGLSGVAGNTLNGAQADGALVNAFQTGQADALAEEETEASAVPQL